MAKMCTPPHAQPVERSHTTTPGIPIQTEAPQSFGTWGGEPTAQGPPSGTLIEVTRTSTLARPSEPKIRILKLETLEKYSGSCEPTIAR